jgi:tellurite resistance protein
MMGGGFVMAPMPMMMPQMMPPPMPMAGAPGYGGAPQGFAPQPPQSGAGFAAAPVAAAAGFAAAAPQAPPPSYAQPTAPQAYVPPAPAAPPPPAAPDEDADDGSPDGVPPWALPDMSNPQERAALLSRMAVIAAADGVVTSQERKLIKKCSKRWGVPFATVEPILKSGSAALQALGSPENPQRFMMGLVAAALIDGKVDRKERMLLDGVAHNMGLDPEVVPGLITAMTEWRNRQAGAQG